MAAGLPACNQALAILRELRGWTQEELAQAAGISRLTVGDYEQGVRELSMRKLWRLAEVMGHSPKKIREALALVRPEAPPRGHWVGPVYFSPAEVQELLDFGSSRGRLAERSIHKMVSQARVLEAAAEARAAAQGLWIALRAERRWRTLVQERPEYQTWALSELLCEESIRATPSKPDRALELAEVAMVVAELAPGEPKWRLRIQGYAQAHVGNAFKVVNAFNKAEINFDRAAVKWERGHKGDLSNVLNGGRVLGLRAAFLTVQEQFGEALKLLDEGIKIGPQSERQFLFLGKAKTLEEAGDYEGALEALRKAAPLIHGKTRQLWNLRYESLVNLCHLKRFVEVEAELPEVKALTIALGNDVDLLRLKWLEGRLLEGLGHAEKAVDCFAVVRSDFAARQFNYDAALAALDMAEVLLRLGRIPELKILARQTAAMFDGDILHSNISRVLHLFLEATQAEAATADLVRRIARYLRRASRRPGLEFSNFE